jgi:hypothetical protein
MSTKCKTWGGYGGRDSLSGESRKKKPSQFVIGTHADQRASAAEHTPGSGSAVAVRATIAWRHCRGSASIAWR